MIMSETEGRNRTVDARPPPAGGLTPMDVTEDVVKIAVLMKPAVEKELGPVSVYEPLWYIKKGGLDYCIRVKIGDSDMVDVIGKSMTGKVIGEIVVKKVTDNIPISFS